MKIRKDIDLLPSYSANEFQADIILDANESAFNIPLSLQNIIADLIKNYTFNRYPPINAFNLRTTIAKRYNLTANEVQVGNGSSSLIANVCQLFAGSENKILYPVPSFSMYETYIRLAQCTPVAYPLTENFDLDIPALIKKIELEQPNLVIICNPNNPTGNLSKLEQLELLLQNTSCPILIDEAYIEFSCNKSMTAYLEHYPQLIILRTFSKAYALANLRLGYILGNSSFIELLNKIILPYPVSGLNLAIGNCIFENLILYQTQIQTIITERNRVNETLQQLGFTTIKSATNFIFFYGASAQQMQSLATTLAQAKIAIRNFTNNATLKHGIRLTIGTPNENTQVLQLIKQCTVQEGR